MERNESQTTSGSAAQNIQHPFKAHLKERYREQTNTGQNNVQGQQPNAPQGQ